MFLTTAEFLPQHRQQLTETRALLEHAEQHDQQRVLQMNRTVEANLLTIIASLEQSTHGSSGCCSAGGKPSGCGCRGQEGHSDAS